VASGGLSFRRCNVFCYSVFFLSRNIQPNIIQHSISGRTGFFALFESLGARVAETKAFRKALGMGNRLPLPFSRIPVTVLHCFLAFWL